ncbi:hypothetical protein [Celeribacter sp.]|uniref:hypothetical protein n=1 Tax=Celeribacter sp. TaxID=1890673 RepID=UPI003A8EBD28
MDKDGFQGMVDRMARAYADGDFASYLDCFGLPLTIVAPSGTIHMTREDDVREMFELYSDGLKQLAVTNTIRIVTQFDDCLDGTYLATVETHFFSGNHRVAEPHRSAFLAKATQDGPRIISIMGTRNPQEAVAIAPTQRET